MGKANYIKCTGTQYIDTGYAPNGTTKIVIDCMLSDSATGNQPICGARQDVKIATFTIWGISSATLRFDYGTTQKSSSAYTPKDRHVYTMSSETGVMVDGVSVTTFTATTFSSPCNLVLSAVNTNGTIQYGQYSIYSCKIYDNDILIRDYIPWRDDSGVYCLKDTVNNTLNYSATSTALEGNSDYIQAGDVLNFPYSGAKKSITLPAGKYKLEVWGAQGGYRSSSSYGGLGGYSVGTINLDAPTTVYVYAGGAGNTAPGSSTVKVGGFNGGGYRYNYAGGGGASDIRIGQDSLYARVIVAGGGGSDGSTNNPGKYGGGTSGGSATESFGSYGYGGTQTGHTTSVTMPSTQPTTNSSSNYPGGFGFGGFGIYRSSGYGGAGGGGWYGGCGSYPDGSGDDDRGGGGGSGYVYTSSTASNYPSGCLLNSSYYLTDAATYAGNTSFTGTGGSSETGHSGNGYCRITVIELYTSFALNVNIGNVWKEVDSAYVNIDGAWKEIEGVWANIGGSWRESG